MSSLSKAGLIRRIAKGKKSRARLTASNLDKGLAFQIRATRERRRWTQADLAEAVGMGQNNISRLENPDYGKYTISSLKRVAEALDVALVVRMVPFTQYVDWLSGTPHLDEGLGPSSMAVPSYEEEEKSGRYQHQVRYYGIHEITPPVTVNMAIYAAPQGPSAAVSATHPFSAGTVAAA